MSQFQIVKMFSPDRQGFFPALWVQFVQDLGEGERKEFAALTERFLLQNYKNKDNDKDKDNDKHKEEGVCRTHCHRHVKMYPQKNRWVFQH